MLRGRLLRRASARAGGRVADRRARRDRLRDGAERRGQVDAGAHPGRPAAAVVADTRASAGIDVVAGGSAFRRQVAFVVGDERSFHYRVSGRGEPALLRGAPRPAGRAGAPARGRRCSNASGWPRPPIAATASTRAACASGWRWRAACWAIREVLLLDEPTLGLDPRGARDLRAFLRDDVIRKPGRTAIVCSNDPSEARALADRVLFLEGGRLRARRAARAHRGGAGAVSGIVLVPVACCGRSSGASWRRWAGTARRSSSGSWASAMAVASMVFLSRFVGAAANPHLAALRRQLSRVHGARRAGRRVPAGRRLRAGAADPHVPDDGDAGGRARDAGAAVDGAGRAADLRVRRGRAALGGLPGRRDAAPRAGPRPRELADAGARGAARRWRPFRGWGCWRPGRRCWCAG